jgi:hypothetical protein
MPSQSPKRGAIPSPRSTLAAAVPYGGLVGAPPNLIMKPQQISFWGNYDHGDCVTAEEAFAKACNNPEIFISEADVIAWATRHGVLEGANLPPVLTWMQNDGFREGSLIYDDGPYFSVDWTNAETLQSAISEGPVKLGIAADQLLNTWRAAGGSAAGGVSGWFATGYTDDANEDHCPSLCGYGSISWLAQQLDVEVPAGVDGAKPGYAMFTWDSIGIIDVPSLIAVTQEAWLRQPTTVTKATLASPVVPSRAEVNVVVRSTDHLDVFLCDVNGAVMSAAWEPDFADGWHGWWQINGGVGGAGAPVHGVSRSADKLDIFVVGTDNRAYTAAWEPDFADGWHGWWNLLGGVGSPGGHITAVSRSLDHLDVFMVGTDGGVYTAAWEPDFADGWHGWWRIGSLVAPQGAPVHCVSRSTDKLDIFVTDINGNVMTAAWEPDFADGWHGWWQINGGQAAPGAAVTAVSRSTDKLDVFVTGDDGGIYTAAWEPDFADGWHGWWRIGGTAAPQGAPVHCVSRSTDKLDIFVTDINGNTMTAAWEPDFADGWHGWWQINGGQATPGAPITCASRSTDHLDVFVVGLDNRVYTAAWEPDFADGWHGWWRMG